MDLLKEEEEEESKVIVRRCKLKRPSLTVMMVCLCFCLIVVLCVFSFAGITHTVEVRRDKGTKITFSTKTPYKFEENLSTRVEKPKGCQASQINMVFRHGTRYPSANDVKKIDRMLDSMRNYSNNKEVKEQLALYGIELVNPYQIDVEKELVAVGDLEMYNIGLRYQKRFPELFNGTFRPSDFRFTSTCKARSSQSASGFAMGFLESHGPIGNGKYQPIPLAISPCKSDDILRFFDMCPKYEKDVAENSTALIEMMKFLNGSEIAQVVKKIKKRLKIDQEGLIQQDVMMMYLMCAFGIGISNKEINAGWCRLFDQEDFDVFEYLLDLKSYYKRSSAFKITYESSCPLLRAILKSMQAKAGRKVTFKKFIGIFRSSHAETLIPLYALMGLLVDKRRLTASNYQEMKNREFKGAKIAPFAGNLAIVLYDCKDGAKKVQVYSNEKLIKLPCCESKIDCPFEVFEKCYQKVSDDCNLKMMCSLNSTLHRDEL